MALARGYAAFSASIDFVKPRPSAVATRFFRAYPRFSTFRRFSLAIAYRLSLYKLVIPYATLAAVFLLATLIAVFYFCFKNSIVPGVDDSNESHPDSRDNTAKLFLIFTSFLHFCIALCVSVALTTAFLTRYSVFDARLAVQGVQRTIKHVFQVPVGALMRLANEAEKVDLSLFSGDKTVNVVVKLFRSNKLHFRAAMKSTQILLGNMNKIDRRIADLSKIFFWFTVAVLLSVLLGLVFSLVCDLSSPKSRSIRMITFSSLVIPLLAIWSHSAASTMLAVATSDFCTSLDEYHKYIDIQAKDSPTETGRIAYDSLFDRYGLTCPSDSPITEQALRHVKTFFAASDGIPEFTRAFDGISKFQNAATWNEAKQWMRSRIRTYKDCDEQLMFAGKLAFYMCDDNPLSVVSGVSIVWLCSCAISFLFSIVIALLALGQPPTEFISARELMYIYGAPKLISILAESSKFLKSHSNFQPWWKSRNDLGVDGSSISSEEASRKNSSTNSSEDDSTISESRERERASYVTRSDRRTRTHSAHWNGNGYDSPNNV
ncbi:unnamed protein product [Agarophyton chilense]|eukprot:gb/GEZJ01002339.1/.p1 GENE.gb/GEZJ01002339.1/~~gb/GEZJ01002339.1/.p1  ORF type:complete len:546 (-),score=70.03 gb/GEZJ01002339.1/:788-2425(-)